MDKALMESIEKFVADNERAILNDIARLVKINSVEAEAKENAPFGEGAAEALKVGLEIAAELGLNTRNCEDYIGYASIGEGDKYLATITHLDIVPTGDGWSEDPFTMREREDYIIGRGVMDDKGPSVLCLYALKYLKDNNIPLNYEIRALLGINEETGMGDVEYYLANYPAPAFCFSPDASFPLCNGEKGIYHGRVVSKAAIGNIVDIKGGFAPNAVCDKCDAWVRSDKTLFDAEDVIAVKEGEVWHLTSSGIGGHASMPEGTKNAIGVMADYILENGLATEDEEKFLRLINLLHHDYTGKLLGVDADDGHFDPLTIVGGMIGVEDGHLWQSLDSRYPTNTDGKKISAAIQEKAGDCAEVIMNRDTEPFYMSLDNPAVQTCIKAYNDVTGENAKPFTMGGGTYARDFPNAVSFGPEHPERPQPDWAGPIHGIDEAANKNYLFEALKIYILALIELQKIEY